jgi:hypothetical protein
LNQIDLLCNKENNYLLHNEKKCKNIKEKPMREVYLSNNAEQNWFQLNPETWSKFVRNKLYKCKSCAQKKKSFWDDYNE